MRIGKLLLALWAASAFLTGVGCHQDQPHDYGRARPPIDQLDERDRGLQSVDLLQASDLMTQSLLSYHPIANSDRQWLIVVGNVENQSSTFPRRNFDIFLDRLKTNISKQGRGRVQIVENLDRFKEMQSRELEGGGSDEFGQGSGGMQPGPKGINPDYTLYGKIQDMPNRGTTLYRFEFNLSALQGSQARLQPWSDEYLVKVER